LTNQPNDPQVNPVEIMELRLVRDSGIGHGSLDRSGGYGFRAEPDVCDPIDEDF